MRLPKISTVKGWDDNYDIIKLQVDEFGRGDKSNLLDGEQGYVREVIDRAVYRWLEEVTISGRDLKEAAQGIYTTLIDCCNPTGVNFARRGRSFTASWSSDYGNKFEVRYCRLKGDAGGVDMAVIKERMDQLRGICKMFNPEDIYNADETGFYLREPSKWSYTTASKTGGVKPDRAHNDIDKGDPETKQPWQHLRIERLPPNSTSVTQPLDAGIISVFKRKFLEMLGSQTLAKAYGGKKISNGEAWGLIPYAWSHVKRSTVRHCFLATKLVDMSAVNLERRAVDVEKGHGIAGLSPKWPPVAEQDKERAQAQHLRMVISAMDSIVELEPDNEREPEELGELAVRRFQLAMQAIERSEAFWNQAASQKLLKELKSANQEVSPYEEQMASIRRKMDALVAEKEARDQELSHLLVGLLELREEVAKLSKYADGDEHLVALEAREENIKAVEEYISAVEEAQKVLDRTITKANVVHAINRNVATLRRLGIEPSYPNGVKGFEATGVGAAELAAPAGEERQVVLEAGEANTPMAPRRQATQQAAGFKLRKIHATSHANDVEAFKVVSTGAPKVYNRTLEMLNDEKEEVRETTELYLHYFNPKV
ncbi:hypothetical protein BGW42_004110 [Actinomortierella wolfii]|nr:hypothetical protein BGW42_004110 [Actinomortierella wolfii]